MILDSLPNLRRYTALHPAFGAAADYLAAIKPEQLVAGRAPIDGDRLYAMVVDAEGKGEAGARLETHRDYLDIQYQVAGTDRIGWSPSAGLTGEGYNPERDLEFHAGRPAAWVDVAPGHFAIFFPADAHAPLGGSGRLLKVVIKIKVA